MDATLAISIFNLAVTFTLFGPLGQTRLGWASLGVMAVGISVIPVLRWTGSVSVAGNVLLAQTWSLLHILALYTGMERGLPAAWITFLPLLAIYICNQLSSLIWTGLAVTEIFVLGWLSFQQHLVTPDALLLYLTTHLGLLALMVSTAYMNERFKDRTLERLSGTNEELSVARDRALEASRAKSTFLANLSHELRTPLNAVIGYSGMLAEDTEAVEPAEMKGDLRRIEASGKHLLRLINELLEFSKLEAGGVPLQVEEFRLDHLIRELVQTMENEASKNGNALLVELPEGIEKVTLKTDPTKLRQCLYNLLSNACKFTSQGEIVTSVHPVSEEEDMITLEVSDTGIGMTEEQLARVFEPFVQAEESISRRFGGTGLGLSLSRSLITALGGSLEAASKVNEGSRFTLTFPKKPQS